MNRMTRTAEDFDYCRDYCHAGDCQYKAGIIPEKCLDARLYEKNRDYEDNGVTVDQIRDAHSIIADAIRANNRLTGRRLDEILVAEAEERLLILPVPFGSDIYTIVTTDRSRGARACPRPVRWIRSGTLTWLNLRNVLEDFGKTVFLTREEAEAALSGGKTMHE